MDKLKLAVQHEKGSNQSMEEVIDSKQREWHQLEEQLREQIDQSNHSIERLTAQLESSRSIIDQSNETIVSKVCYIDYIVF